MNTVGIDFCIKPEQSSTENLFKLNNDSNRITKKDYKDDKQNQVSDCESNMPTHQFFGPTIGRNAISNLETNTMVARHESDQFSR